MLNIKITYAFLEFYSFLFLLITIGYKNNLLKYRELKMKLILMFLLSGLIISCKPEANSRTSNATKNNILENTIIKGNAMLGPVEDADVVAYSILPTGTLDLTTPLASTKTDMYGNYSLIIPNNILTTNPLGIQITGGRYIEEASGNIILLENKSLTTVIPKIVKGSQIFAAVGPLAPGRQ